MASRIKEKGREELGSFKRRVKRQASMERISREDEDWLVARVEEIERRINTMKELPDKEKELW